MPIKYSEVDFQHPYSVAELGLDDGYVKFTKGRDECSMILATPGTIYVFMTHEIITLPPDRFMCTYKRKRK